MTFEEWWGNGKGGWEQDAPVKGWFALAWSAAQEAMRERAADATWDHSCKTYSELCDCAGHIRKDILALPVE